VWRVVKWFAVVVAGLLVVIALGVTGLLLYLRTEAGHTRLREFVQARGRDQVPGLHIGQLGGDLLHDVWLGDVTIRDAEGRPAIHVDRVSARYRLSGLLHRRLDLLSVHISGPRLLVRPRADGSLNVEHLVVSRAPSAGPPAGELRVDELTLHDGRADIVLADGRHIRITDFRFSSSGRVRAGEIVLGTTDLRAAGDIDDRPYDVALVARGRLSDTIDVTVKRLAVTGLIADGPVVLEASALGPRDRVAVHLDVAAPRSSLRVHGTVGLGDHELGDYDLRSEAHQVNPRWFSPGAPTGQLSGHLTMRGSGIPLRVNSHVHLDLALEPSVLDGRRISELRLRGETRGTSWTLHEARVRGTGLDITLRGQGAGRDIDVDAQAHVAVPKDAPLLGFHGRGELQLHARGRFPSALTVNVQASGSQLSLGPARIAALRLQAALSGDVRRPRGRLTLMAQGVQTADWPTLARVALDVTGDGHDLAVSAKASGPQLQTRIKATLRVTRDEVLARVQTLGLGFLRGDTAESLHLLAPATIRWTTNRHLEIQRLRVQGQGTYSGRVAVDGRIEFGDLPRGRATLNAQDVQVPGVDRFAGHADVVLDEGQGELQMRIAVGGAQLRVDARVPLTREAQPRLAARGPVAVHVVARQVRPELLPLLGRQLARHGVNGAVVDVVARVEGDMSRPDAHGRVELHDLNLRAGARHLPRLNGLLTVDSEANAVRSRLQLATPAGATLQAHLRLGRTVGDLVAGKSVRDAPVDLNAELRGLDLASLAQVDDRLLDVGGILVASIRVQGTWARPQGVADVVLTAGHVDKLQLGPVQAHAEFQPDGTRVRLDVVEVAGGQLHAQVDWDRSRVLRAHLTAQGMDPAFARLFWAQLREAGGSIDADVQAHGTLDAPDVRGTMTWRHGRLGLVGQPTFADVNADVRIATGRVDLDKLHASSAGGSLDAQGFVIFQGFTPVHAVLSAHANRFVVAAGGASGLRLNGDFALDAALHQSVLSGQIRVPRALLWLPSLELGGRKLQDTGPRSDVHFVDEAAKAAEEKHRHAGPPLQLDLQATADNVRVRGQNLDLEVVSNLHLGSAPDGAPALTGTVEIRRGRIDVSGQRFDFDYGRIAFDGTPVPRLDIRVTHQFPEALVAVELRGTPQKPELSLSSDPPTLDQAQIISLILTGQAGGQPSSDTSFDPKAAVASAVLGQIADKLAPRLGVDVLRVQSAPPPAEAAAAGTPGTRLEVGKYISSRVYLSYAHVFGASVEQNANEASVEYRISRRWILETIFGDAGVGSVDALWTYRY
jgi:autotransporter translocation and assembly factor TamB